MKTVLDEKLGDIHLLAQVSEDQLGLFVSCEKVEGGDSFQIDESTISMLLKPVIALERLNTNLLKTLLDAINAGKKIQEKPIARGVAPTNGEDGSIEYVVKCAQETSSKDTTFVRNVDSVVPGCLVARILPPTAGDDGSDVFGNPITASPGNPAKPQVSQALVVVEPAEEGGIMYLRVANPGYLLEQSGRTTIISDLKVEGDVDISTGHINYIGTVSVTGDMSKGLSIAGRRGIEIGGRTHGGSLESITGSIVVRGFVSGQVGDSIVAGSSIEANMIQQMKVTAEEQITVTRDVLDSIMLTHSVLSMPKGHLLGREAKALIGIEAGVVGSGGGSKPALKGFSPAEIEEEISETKKELAKIKETMAQISKNVAPMLMEGVKLPTLKKTQILSINKLLLELDRLTCLKEVLERRIDAFEGHKERPTFQVNYHDTLHKGATIEVGEEKFVAESDMKGPATITYQPDSGKFLTSPLKALKKTLTDEA